MAAKHELYVIRGKTLDTIADNVRTVLGIDPDEPIRFDETTLNNTTQANGDIDAQADIIAQIQTALEGKAAGGGGTEEIETLIDQSGVLDGTFEGTVEEKVASVLHSASLLRKTTTLYFANSDITHIDVYIDWAKNIDLANTKKLQYIEGIDMTKLTIHPRYLFEYSGIVTVKRPLDLSAFTSYYGWENAFLCPKLKDILFMPETINGSIIFTSPVLSAESIQSILGGLNNEVTGRTLTIPRNAVKKAFETSKGANDGDTSETWNALVASKPNWTITLS